MARVRVHQHVNPHSPYYRQTPDTINLSAVFADPALPLHIDIGCARGRFILGMAEIDPAGNYLGIEIREPLVSEANRLASEAGLTNLHYVFCNAMLFLDRLLADIPDSSVHAITIQFPDPWFKKRHAKRRMVNSELVMTVADKIAEEGRIFVQTDIEFLAVEMFELFRADERLMELKDSGNPFPIKTEREKAVEDKNGPVFRAMFVKDPDYELNRPLDKRYVVAGLVMMIVSLPIAVVIDNQYLKYFLGLCFLTSFLVMTKKEKKLSISKSSLS